MSANHCFWAWILFVACAQPRARVIEPAAIQAKGPAINLSEKSYPFSELEVPQQFWNEQTAIEAVTIWSALCNECHGGRRKTDDAVRMPPPGEDWGRGSGLFFGRRRPYREIFLTIFSGGPERNGKPSEMPAWGKRLSKEQIWSLAYFLEYQSGGIEGIFPPSLYPRGSGDE